MRKGEWEMENTSKNEHDELVSKIADIRELFTTEEIDDYGMICSPIYVLAGVKDKIQSQTAALQEINEITKSMVEMNPAYAKIHNITLKGLGEAK